MRHNVEVDQSIKIEDAGDTVLAFANGISHAVVLSARVKRNIFQTLVNRGESREVARLMIFAGGLFLLVEDYLDQINRLVIDTEYTGKEAEIRALLLRHIWRKVPIFDPQRIMFEQVGKKSPAHKKAEAVRKKRDAEYRRISPKELFQLLE